jgi:hypothetical protein
MTAHPRKTRLTLHEPLGMAEPLRAEAREAAIARIDSQALSAALARIPVHRLPAILAEALTARTGKTQTARRIAEAAADIAGGLI